MFGVDIYLIEQQIHLTAAGAGDQFGGESEQDNGSGRPPRGRFSYAGTRIRQFVNQAVQPLAA